MHERYALGVDLGGTKVAAGVVSQAGDVIAMAEEATRVETGVEGVIGNIAKAARAALAKVPGLQIDGVGIGAPGICDAEQGLVVFAPNLKWNRVPVRQLVERELGLPTYLENDANAAALGEQWAGAAKGAQHVVMVTLGTGVGGGLIINGQIYAGSSGYGGEIGHIPVLENGPQCGCGNLGCLETLASATAMGRFGREAVEAGLSPAIARHGAGRPDGIVDAKAVLDAAREGDETANAIIRKVAGYLGFALAGLVNSLNPEKIVIGGGVSRVGELLVGPIREETFRRAMPGPREQAAVVAATLGNEAGLIGAATLVWRAQA